MDDDLRFRVTRRLTELNLKPFQAAESVGLERGFIRDIIKGRKKSVQEKNLLKLAEALDCDVEYLTGRQATPRKLPADPEQGILVAGVCETGVWRSTAARPKASRIMPLIGNNPSVAAYEIRGTDAEPLGILDGDIVVVVPYLDWLQAHKGLRDQTLCVIRRTRKTLKESELSIRTASVTSSGTSFIAPLDGNNPPQLEPVPLADVEVIGVVRQAIRIFD